MGEMDAVLARGRPFSRWSPIIYGLGLGLYISRIVAESTRGPWSAPKLFLLLLLCETLGLVLIIGGQNRVLGLSALILLYVYVVWPRTWPWLAQLVGFLVLCTLLYENKPQRLRLSPMILDLAVFLAALALYVQTLAPTVLPADSGEFQLVAYRLGIAHPPGYPLYTLLGKLFTLLPIGDYAYRVNLLSAVAAALALAVLYRLVRRVSGSAWAAMVAVIALGASPTYWAQGTTANIRALTALFAALQLYLLFRYGETRERKYLIGFAVAFGLGIAHHGSLSFLALPYALYLWAAGGGVLRRWREWVPALAGFLLSLSVFVYLPVRSWLGVPHVPESFAHVEDVLDHILARGFRGDMFAFAQLDLLRNRLPVLANILVFQFGYPLLALAALGLVVLGMRRRRLFLLFGGAFLVNAFVAITYRAPQTVEYLMPAYVALMPIIGEGVGCLSRSRRVPTRAALASLALWLALGNLAAHYPSYAALSRDRSTRGEAEALLRDAPQRAVILANWHQATPLWYLQYAEGWRPDVRVEYVYPEGATPLAEVWQRRIVENLARGPVLVTNHYAEFDRLPYRFLPLQRAEQVIAEAVGSVPPYMNPLDAVFDAKIRFCGYQLLPEDGKAMAGEEIVIRLCWQPVRPLEREYSFFVHLVDPTGGPLLAQGDRTHAAMRYEVGEVIIDEYRLPLLPTVAAGRYALLAGAYITFADGRWERLRTAAGQDAVSLAEVVVAAQKSPPATTHPLDWAFANGLRCVGVDYDSSLPDMWRVYLHFHRMRGSEGDWDALLYQAGQPVARARIPAGEGYVTVALDVPDDGEGLNLELRSAGDEQRSAPLGPWHRAWQRTVPLPAPRRGERHVVLGGAIVLEHAAWKAGGSTVRVNLRWQALRPLTRDYSTSVQLIALDGRLLAQHDTTPALGALPTLKWITGTTVMDPHFLSLSSPGMSEAILHLSAYDAFTLQPLAIGDDRLARLGQGTQMELGSLSRSELPTVGARASGP